MKMDLHRWTLQICGSSIPVSFCAHYSPLVTSPSLVRLVQVENNADEATNVYDLMATGVTHQQWYLFNDFLI
ncbi:unnamed protein product [Ranitomeya imitator]|uniref:PAN2 UCH domain-containing protein n=1 Tax=Ranitomeya imitator TaxID=111125 RepID=A0ABN9MH92_9NEOB|nr:unnamed protein product [Ranitomeya imitator]